MSIVQISTFYLANLATPPRGRAPGARGVPPTTKLHKTKSSWNLILGGVPFMKNVAILTFENRPSRAHGFPPPGALGVARNKKLHNITSSPNSISGGVSFMEKTRIPKFWSPPRPAAPSGPVIFGRRPKIKIPLPTFCQRRPPDSEKV